LAQSLLQALADPTAHQPTAATALPMSTKQREQLIASLESTEMQKRARHLFFDSMDQLGSFHEAVQRLASQAGIMLRQPDKKERWELGAEQSAEVQRTTKSLEY
jgi:hypothetical protein